MTLDKMQRGRFFAYGGLVHVEKQAKAAYALINAIDRPPRRKPKRPDTMTIEEHLAAIESIVVTVREYLRDGCEPRGGEHDTGVS